MKRNVVNFVGLILLMIMLVSCGGEEARKAKYFEKGKSYYELGNYDKAKIELKNVLQIDPKFADAYYLLGEVEEKNKNIRGAYAHYFKAAELDESNLDARNKLARLYLLSGNLEKAQEKLDEIMAKDPQSPHVKMLELLISARKGEIDKAISIAKSLIEKDKNQTDAIFVLSNLYLRKDKLESAINTLEEGVKANPDVVALRLQLGGIYARKKDYDNAEKVLKEIIALKPDDFGYRQRLAKFYINMKEYDKAETALRDAVSLDAEDESRKLMLVEFLARYKGVKDAETELLAAIQDYPDAFSLKFAQAKLYEKIKPEQVEAVYNGIIDLSGVEPEGLKARVALAQIAMKKKEHKKASQYVSEVLAENPRDIQALLIKGKLALVSKDPVSAIAAFRSIIKDKPDMVEASQFLAIAHMFNKEPELAKEVLMQSIESASTNPKAYLNYAQYLIERKNYDDANLEIDKALKISQGNLDVLQMKLNVASLLNDKEMVASTIELIKNYHPTRAIGYQKSGDFNLALKKYDKAISDYEKSLEVSGKMLPALASIIKVNLITKNYASAISRLEKISKEQPKNAIPMELLGEVYLAKKNFPQAEKYIKEAIRLNPRWSLPYNSLANIYLAKNDIPSAINAYESALAIIPDDTSIYARLAQIYERTKKYDEAINMYEKILQIKPDDALASNNLAAILSDIRDDAASLQRARDLAIKFENSNQPGFLDTLGWIYYRTEEYPKAIELLAKVVKIQPQISLFQYHLGMAYYKSGDKENAKVHLRKALDAEQKFKGRSEAENILKQL